jgi:hypothetical protein
MPDLKTALLPAHIRCRHPGAHLLPSSRRAFASVIPARICFVIPARICFRHPGAHLLRHPGAHLLRHPGAHLLPSSPRAFGGEDG